MRNILNITLTNMKRSKYGLLLSLFCAIMLCVLLNSMGTLVTSAKVAKVAVGVLDYDQSSLSKDLKRYMREELNYDLKENDTYKELSMELINKDISIIIEIPDHLQEDTLVGKAPGVTVTSLEDYENSAFAKANINSYFSSIQLLSGAAQENADSFNKLLEAYHKEEINLTRNSAAIVDMEVLKGHNGFINSIGFFLMFIFTISIIIAFMVVDDRVTGVFNRVSVTPVKAIHYVIGTGLYGTILCAIEIVIFSSYIYVKKNNTGIPLGTIILFMSLYSLFTVCFSMLVAMATKSKNALTAIIIGVSTIGCILGGAYFPIDLAPKSMQNMARILPQYWFMDALRRIQENSLANIVPNIIIMVLFVVLSLLIGAVLYSQNYKTN